MTRLFLICLIFLISFEASPYAQVSENAQSNVNELPEWARPVMEPLQQFRTDAENGSASAQYKLGNIYFYGQYGYQHLIDTQEAARWYELSAMQGYAMAQLMLGIISYRNEDYINAAKWYGLAARQGNSQAQYHIAVLYEAGLGVPQNYIVAHMWANLSSIGGNTAAAEYRERIAKRLQLSDVSVAQQRAIDCLASNFHNC